MISDEAPVTEANQAAILATAADYIEGWIDGDAERMARCLHPDLAKRAVAGDDPDQPLALDEIDRAGMVEATSRGVGRKYSGSYETRLLDAFGGIASVAVLSQPYMDYLHVARFGDRWLIVNALWQRRPGR
ncbi:MAG TPA: nuclear transport factor 2 family protein [Candidatus Limnocylindrales bacterium]|nr:nuclear transport factor 2 family protein [Candidatus Limnocylindrales bacterium]